MRIYICGQKRFGAAVLKMCLEEGYEVAGASSPPFASDGDHLDRLRSAADLAGIAWMPAGSLRADNLPEGVDVILAAHSHDFIGRRTRNAVRIGALGYHPSLLPRHRGRDAVRWAVRMGEPVTGGTVFWLTDNVDAGPVAAQDWCFIRREDSARMLWRRELFPMGVRLFRRVLRDLDRGVMVSVDQDEELATWEPSWEREPLFRPELLQIGAGLAGLEVRKEREALHVGERA
jgi:methionyl-tRNA formyltransferase